MPAPTFVAASNTTYASRTNTTVNKPSGTVDGDLIVLLFLNGQSGSYGAAPTPPAGFTALPSTPIQVNGWSFFVSTRIYYKFASGEGASWTFTHSAITTQALAVAYRGVNTTTPLDVTSTINSGGGSTRTWTGLTTVTADAMLLALGHDFADTATALTPPTGFTERIDVNPLVYAAEKVQASPGATGNFTQAINNTSAESKWAGVLLALRPAAGGAVTGTLAGTLPRLTAAASGTVKVAGTLAASTPRLTSAATGTVGVSGGLAGALPRLVSSMAGTVGVAGSLAASLPRLTAAGSGAVGVAGSLSATLPRLTSDMAGTVTGHITGTLAATLPRLTSSMSGTVAVAGTLSCGLPRLTSSIVATVTVAGTLAATLPAITGSGAGTITVPGTLAATLPRLTSSMTGYTPINADRAVPYRLDVEAPAVVLIIEAPRVTLDVESPGPVLLDVESPASVMLDVAAPTVTLELSAPVRTLEITT